MKRIIIFALLTSILLSTYSYSTATAAPLTWTGTVTVLGKTNAGYDFVISNAKVIDNGSVYTEVLWLRISNCTNLNVSCPMTKRVRFTVKKSTNTFLLKGEPAFFAFYWPNYTLSETFYNLGYELKPLRIGIYLHNDSKENFIGWGIDLTGRPRTIEKCVAVSAPQANGSVLKQSRCLKAEPENFTTDLTFKGPYPVTGLIYYNSDPFGVAKNGSVMIWIDVVNSPQARTFLRSIKDVPENNHSVKLYLMVIGLAAILGLAVWRWKK